MSPQLKSGGSLDVTFHGFGNEPCRLGSLQQGPGGLIGFEYDDEFIRRGREVSPVELPLGQGLRSARPDPWEGLFGLFADSLPDSWGRLLMNRVFRDAGITEGQITPLDRLAFLGDRTMGALTYQPAAELPWPDGGAVDLGKLARAALQVLAGTERELLPQLVRAGGSPGGARPKFLVGFHPGTQALVAGGDGPLPEGYQSWMVNVPAHPDPGESGPVEAAYAAMAEASGLIVAPFRLFETKEATYFGCRRFDREGTQRVHVHSFAGLIGIHPSNFSAGYKDLLGLCQWLTRDQASVLMAFRYMAFNVLAHNRDDHAKNFSFLQSANGQWRLAPAYDLTFAEGPGGQHSLSLETAGANPTVEALVKVGRAYQLERQDCLQVLKETAEAVGQWPKFAAKFGVPRSAQNEISRRLRAIRPTGLH